MGAGLAAPQEEIAIPPHQGVVARIVKMRLAVVAQDGCARLAGGRWPLAAWFDNLIGERKGRKHGIVEIERCAEENVELTQPVHPVDKTRRVSHVQTVESHEVRRRAKRVEVLSEYCLRRDVVGEQLSAGGLNTPPSATGSAPVEIQ